MTPPTESSLERAREIVKEVRDWFKPWSTKIDQSKRIKLGFLRKTISVALDLAEERGRQEGRIEGAKKAIEKCANLARAYDDATPLSVAKSYDLIALRIKSLDPKVVVEE